MQFLLIRWLLRIHSPQLYSKFINMVMMNGEKFLARTIVYGAFEEIKRIQLKKYFAAKTDAEREAIECDPRKIFHSAIKNCTPALKLTPVTRGGITYQVPCFVRDKEAQFMALKWMGRVVKKKQDLHRQCETNRAYAHYRWS
ncbi:unnamed protein product [Soboliphyme baturini]|uniref:Ribosomal_S7 domain-containing protein n=1 Tax=Soboliphyme baturini TaxID=241478 RepID=A0A183IBF0_9BILA|nr:unnamed protein product [Soboliphyme baturini]